MMKTIDIIILAVIASVLIMAAVYVFRQRKKGNKCIGCPDSKNCPNAQNGNCNCS